jgi:serine/threonine protein kinase
MNSSPFPAGKQLKNFILDGILGSGAFSTVYKSTNSETSETLAIKIISKSLLTDPNDSRHLQLEVDAIAILHHPNICALHDFFSDPDYYSLVLDYCAGGNLEEYVSARPVLREAQAAMTFHQIVSAMHAALPTAI